MDDAKGQQNKAFILANAANSRLVSLSETWQIGDAAQPPVGHVQSLMYWWSGARTMRRSSP
jgi:hypothetical protein